MADSGKVPIHVTPMGHRYVEVRDLLRNERVQETLKKMTDLSKKHEQKSVGLKQKEK